MRVLFIGDVVGGPGRRGLRDTMPALREQHAPDLIVVNGENSAGGVGITERPANDLFGVGTGVITTGNHVYRHREAYDFLERERLVIRPANYPQGNPGRGYTVVDAGGMRVAVINLSGAIGLKVARSPFDTVDAILDRVEADAVVVDFHAEVTSEKVAMGWHLDGRVSAVFGTHTHVPTADARILPAGTAVVTDVGMVGPLNSIIGATVEPVLHRFLTQMPVRHSVPAGPVGFNAVLVTVDEASGRGTAI